MSTFAQRKKQSGWLEPPDKTEVSPASLWAPDYEEESARGKSKASKAAALRRLDETAEPVGIDAQDPVKGPSSSLWTCEDLVTTLAHEHQLEEEPEALLCAPAPDSEDTQESIFADAALCEEAEIQPTGSYSMPVAVPQDPSPTEIVSQESAANQREDLPHEAIVTPAAPRQSTTPRTLVLDESAVLPNEASFATVALRQEVPSRPRVLDESAVLPGEVSFATVRLYQKPARSYSSANRFGARLADSARKLIPVLMIIAVCGAAIIVRQKFKNANDTVQPASTENVTTKPLVTQTEKVAQTQQESVSNAEESVPTSSSSNETVSAPLSTDTKAEEAIAVTPEPAERLAPANPSVRNAGAKAESSATLRLNRKARPVSSESEVTTRTVRIPKSSGVDSPAQNSPRVRSEPAVTSVNDGVKAEPKSQPAVTGGAQRPRRVKQQTESANSPSPAPVPE